MTQHNLAAQFRRLHTGSQTPLVLANAWDAMSARLVEAAGAAAIATTSAGVSWSLGYPDGHGVTRDLMVDAVRRIVQSVRIPVSADVESGYGSGTPEDVAETATRMIEAGAVGINLEDSPGHGGEKLVDMAYQSARFASARAAAGAADIDLFINARVDTYLKGVGDEGEPRFEETVRRANAYVASGADCVFIPLVTDPALIKRLVAAIAAPINLLVGPGSPPIDALRELGVARVSVGPHLVRSVMAHIRKAAREVLSAGTYDALSAQLTSPEANGLFAPRP